MDRYWISFEDNKKLFEKEAKRNCECLFDNGESCRYDDEHPFAILTHFKLSEISVLESENKQLREDCEKLKCCGNCRTPFHAMNPTCVACIRGVQLVTRAEKKDNWTPQESKQ